MAQTLGICLAGTAVPTIDLMVAPWHLESMRHGVADRKLALVGDSDADGEFPARRSRRGNSQHEYRLRVVGKSTRDDVQSVIGGLEQAVIEAERVVSEGNWIDPGLDLVRVAWQPDGGTITMWRPIVGGVVEQLTVQGGADHGYTELMPVVNVTLDVGPAWYGARAELRALADTDSDRIAENSAVAFDLDAPGGDLPPWVDLLVTENDSFARHHVAVKAESPRTGDTEWVPASSLITTGYGGTLVGGGVGQTSTDWRYMCEIPAQSHSRPRMLVLPHASGDGQVRVRWKAGGSERVSNVIQLPGSGNFADVEACIVEGDWAGVIEARGTVAVRGLRFDGTDGYASAATVAPAGVAAQGQPTHEDDFSGSGNLNGQALDLGGSWVTSGGTTDWVAFDGAAQRGALGGSAPRIGFAGTQTPAQVSASARFGLHNMVSGSSFYWPGGTGLIVRYVDSSNFLFAGIKFFGAGGLDLGLIRVVSGSSSSLAAKRFQIGVWSQVWCTVEVGTSGAWSFTGGVLTGSVGVSASGQDLELATGGQLEQGRVGIYDWYGGAQALTRRISDFRVTSTPWQPDALIPVAGDLRLAGGVMLRDTGEVSYRGNGLVDLAPQHQSRLYLAAKRSRGVSPGHAENGTDNLRVSVHARPRYLSVPTLAP